MDQATFLSSIEAQIRALTVRLEAAAAKLDDEAWERAIEGGWSPAGIVRHMVLANGPYLAKLPAVVASRPAGVAQQVRHTWAGRTLLKFAGPHSNAPAPQPMHPGPGPFGRAVLSEWKGQQEAIHKLVEMARDVDICRAKFANPFLPFLRMSVADALAIFAAHTERHVGQIEARL